MKVKNKASRTNKANRKKSAQRWVTMGAIVACSAVGSKTINVASAQTVPQSGGAISQTQTLNFDIMPGPLSDVLSRFARAAGITFTLSNDSIGTITSPGVNGSFTVQDGLKRLLDRTGVSARFTAPTAVIFELAGRNDSVNVTARAPGADPYADPYAPYKADRLSSDKFAEPIANTARSVTVLTQEVLEDKHATTIREAMRSTAGVTLGSGEGGNAFGDRFFIRGYDARNDVFVDGVRDPGVSIRENFDDEQVEILRGPASSFAGRGTTGGALNIVTKEAQDTNFIKGEMEGGFEDADKRGTVDVNHVVNSQLDVRLNALIQGSDVAGRDFTTDNRWGLAGNVAWHPTTKFRTSVNFSHTYMWGRPDFGVPYDQATKAPVTENGLVARNTYYGATNRDFTKSSQDMGTLNLEYDLTAHITLEDKLRISHSLLNYIGTIPENPSATGVTAPYSSTPTFFSGYVQLNAQSRYEPVDVINNQPEIKFRFQTGEVRQTVIAGGEFSSERISIQGYSGLTSELTTGPVAFTSSGAPIVSVFNPPHVFTGANAIVLAGNPLVYHVGTKAGYLMDTANYHDVIIFNAGLRYDDYNIKASTNTASNRANSGIYSYNLGLVIKPTKIVSIYGAYATAADPVGDELDATASAYGGFAATQNAAQIYGPQKSKSYEIGTKLELFDKHLLFTAAPFENVVTNARETAPAGVPGYVSGTIVAGAAYRVRGLDFETAGKITSKWSVMGGWVIMSPRVTNSVVPTNIGLQLANIAPRSFNLLTKYQLTRRFEIGGQGIYVSQIKGGSLLAANGGVAYPGIPNPTLIPAHWRFDIFAEAKISEHTSFKVYAQNLANKLYYDALYQSGQPFIQVAPGRAVHASLIFKF